MKQEELISIYATKYYTPSGEETCSLDVERKRMCPFLRTSHFGTSCHCLFNPDALMKTSKEGFLIPVEGCPVISNYIFIEDK